MDTDKLLRSKKSGDKWVVEALPTLVEIQREKSRIESCIDTETAEWKQKIADVKGFYREALSAHADLDKAIRDRILVEHEGTEAVVVEGVGSATFPVRKTFKVVDVKRVPAEYLGVDSVLVNEAIKKGLRKIPGIEIVEVRGLTVRLEKEERDG